MGIKGLHKLIENEIKKTNLKDYRGKKVAIDANLALNNFIWSIKNSGEGPLCNKNHEITSHLYGLFYSTIAYLENEIRPIYVFDGTSPPEKKIPQSDLTEEHCQQAKNLLELMGIPFITAESEAEAQCCALNKEGKVDYVATDDMDALPFGANVILRNITKYGNKRRNYTSSQIEEIKLKNVLKSWNLNIDELIDLCILLGCSYCKPISDQSSKSALDDIKEYKTIENIITNKRYKVSKEWESEMNVARELFKDPKIIKDLSNLDLNQKQPNKERLVSFLCDENQFNEEKVKSGAEILEKLFNTRDTKTQTKLDSFFKNLPSSSITNKTKFVNKSEKN